MRKDWGPPNHSALQELAPARPPRRIPGRFWMLAAFLGGALLTLALLGITDAWGGDGHSADELQAAYDSGLAAGTQQARAELATAVEEAQAAAYTQGWRAGALAANPARASAFEISPLLHYKVPLSQLPADWLAQCPTAVPTLMLVLAGYSQCYSPAP